MYKAASLAVLLLAVFTFTSGSQSVGAVPISPTSPMIVAKGVLQNQTEPFAATLYTPTRDGLYRLSAYATLVTPNPNSNSYWGYSFSWTDASGTTQNQSNWLITYSNKVPGQFYWADGQFSGGTTITFQANKGIPILHQMAGASVPDGTVWSLYYTLERLE